MCVYVPAEGDLRVVCCSTILLSLTSPYDGADIIDNVKRWSSAKKEHFEVTRLTSIYEWF